VESDKRYSLVKIEGVDDPKAASFYLGKKVAFVYRAKREVRGSNIRVIWGKVTRPHGTSTKSRLDRFRSKFLTVYRQLRCCSRQVPLQPSPQVLRCHRPRHALPLQHLSGTLYLVGDDSLSSRRRSTRQGKVDGASRMLIRGDGVGGLITILFVGEGRAIQFQPYE